MNFDFGIHGGGEYFFDGALQFFDEVNLFDTAFAELSVAHDLGDDPIGALDLLFDDFDLFGGRFALGKRALQGIGGIIDDGQRVLELVGEFSGQAPGGLQLSFANGKLAQFLFG